MLVNMAAVACSNPMSFILSCHYNCKPLTCNALYSSCMAGESEAKLRSLFQEALDVAPCIVFIGEVEGHECLQIHACALSMAGLAVQGTIACPSRAAERKRVQWVYTSPSLPCKPSLIPRRILSLLT